MDFFTGSPHVLYQRLDECILRFQDGTKIYGGYFIGMMMSHLVKCGVVSTADYDQWGITWHPTFADLLQLIDRFFEVGQANTSEAA